MMGSFPSRLKLPVKSHLRHEIPGGLGFDRLKCNFHTSLSLCFFLSFLFCLSAVGRYSVIISW